MVRKVISILFFIGAGFFVYLVGVLAFMNAPDHNLKKFAVLGGFAVPGVISMGIGLGVEGFGRWRTRVGTVLVSGAAATAFVAGMIGLMILEPELKEMFTPQTLELLSDYPAGIAYIGGALGIGTTLLINGRKIRREQPL